MLLECLFIADAGEKGKGVFTSKNIPEYTIIEVAPVIVFTTQDRLRLEATKLYYYIFEWGDDVQQGAVGLGYTSMYNHQSPSNCEYCMDFAAETITVQTMRDVQAGEELTINYAAGWQDWQPVWFAEQ